MLINSSEIIIKNSRFIGYLYEIKNKEMVKDIINNLKKDHKKAKHFPYAFILDNTAGKSDDKEPNGTAGIPIYNELKRASLNNHLLVIVRYFGGTKLGAGNLLRTYLRCAINTIKKEEFN